jgi:biofilm protein TabA
MILARLEQAERYLALHQDFAAAFAFLREGAIGDQPPGRIEIGRGMYAVVSQSPARPRSEALLEAHRKYIDIQYVIAGIEEIGWKSRSGCQRPRGDYDAERDIEFFGDTPESYLTVRCGQFTIFFPDDAHAPLIGTGKVHKIVIKVPL